MALRPYVGGSRHEPVAEFNHAAVRLSQAADMLNVSRPHLVKLLEGGALPFHKTGKHRRIRFADLMSFKAERDRASAQAMEELAKQAQELQLGYE
jgi:excisionase family DNA binding protein